MITTINNLRYSLIFNIIEKYNRFEFNKKLTNI